MIDMTSRSALALLPFLFLLACGEGDPPGPPEVRVEDPWARAMSAGGNSAVYLTLVNAGGREDLLRGAETGAAASAEIHESRMEGEVMRMREVGEIPVPAGAEVELAPGGLHIMLLDLQQSLTPGDSLELILHFRETGAVELRVPVRRLGGG
jgi:copper(I)-binding protein